MKKILNPIFLHIKTSRSAFSISQPIECFKTTFKKREGPNRGYVLIFMVMTALTWISFTEEWTIAYPYVRTRYHWGLTEYTQYKSIVQASTIGGKLFLL